MTLSYLVKENGSYQYSDKFKLHKECYYSLLKHGSTRTDLSIYHPVFMYLQI